MIKVLEDALKKVRQLSEERQEFAAEVLETIAAQDDGVYCLTEDERTEVRAG
jgi:DNA-binding protein H-NS